MQDSRNVAQHYMDTLELTKICERKIADLSGGELQRFAIAIVCVQEADVYMFDEPSSYLDVKQRLVSAMVSSIFHVQA
jgi:ATP-binding cassette subfamily E protein 1